VQSSRLIVVVAEGQEPALLTDSNSPVIVLMLCPQRKLHDFFCLLPLDVRSVLFRCGLDNLQCFQNTGSFVGEYKRRVGVSEAFEYDIPPAAA
jgi:hypothetical protein